MRHLLQRHPVPVEAFFRDVLVLTYAFPKRVLEPLLPPGLILDTYKDFGFLAIAMVQTEQMRPSGFPAAFGQKFFLSGYRIFARYPTRSGKTLRGLRILRSDTDKSAMALFGNLLTHYHYQKADVSVSRMDHILEVAIQTPDGQADLHVIADLSSKPAALPANSPFETLRDARRFAGPLPFTFDYEKETHSIIRIQGVRTHWNPQPVAVKVLRNSFLEQPPFFLANPLLASAFHLQDVPYRWERGVRETLEGKNECHG